MLTLPLLTLGLSLIAPSSARPTKSRRDDLNPYPDKQRILYRPDGTFKITVFSDMHTGENPDSFGPGQDIATVQLMNTVLSDENPDYVVLNGDQITGENTLKENSTMNVDTFVAPLNEHGMPFSSVYGNHDNDINITHGGIMKRELEVAKNTFTRNAVGDPVSGPANYWVPVYAKEDDEAPALVMWFFDSRGGWSPEHVGVESAVDPAVADWIKSETEKMDAAWGEDRAAVAFVHIPPNKIGELQGELPASVQGFNEDKLGDGTLQTATDAAFYDAVTGLKNLKAIVSGHDHGNEWCARESSKQAVFCFAKHSGYGGYDRGWGRGVRNIIFKSTDPAGAVDTEIRLEDGTRRAQVTLDAEFKRSL